MSKKKSNKPNYEKLASTFDKIRELTKSSNLTIVTATQCNRNGQKSNLHPTRIGSGVTEPNIIIFDHISLIK